MQNVYYQNSRSKSRDKRGKSRSKSRDGTKSPGRKRRGGSKSPGRKARPASKSSPKTPTRKSPSRQLRVASGETLADIIDKVGTADSPADTESEDETAFRNNVRMRTRSSKLSVDEKTSSSSINSTNITLRSVQAKRNLLDDASPAKVKFFYGAFRHVCCLYGFI